MTRRITRIILIVLTVTFTCTLVATAAVWVVSYYRVLIIKEAPAGNVVIADGQMMALKASPELKPDANINLPGIYFNRMTFPGGTTVTYLQIKIYLPFFLNLTVMVCGWIVIWMQAFRRKSKPAGFPIDEKIKPN